MRTDGPAGSLPTLGGVSRLEFEGELEELRRAVLEHEVEIVEAAVKAALDKGAAPIKVLEVMTEAMRAVGERFEAGDYFLADLIMAAETFNKGLRLIEPLLQSDSKVRSLASIVIGTVEGDVHDIGKNIVATMLKSAGFTVHDIGVDVPPKKFVEKVKETKAEILGLSALLTSSLKSIRETIKEVESAGLKDDVKVIVGGSAVTREYAEEVGANGYSEDAVGAIPLCKKLLGKENQ
ncbi:MAG: corrinoid protein [Candidatus Bathyarchaeia archaeon]